MEHSATEHRAARKVFAYARVCALRRVVHKPNNVVKSPCRRDAQNTSERQIPVDPSDLSAHILIPC